MTTRSREEAIREEILHQIACGNTSLKIRDIRNRTGGSNSTIIRVLKEIQSQGKGAATTPNIQEDIEQQKLRGVIAELKSKESQLLAENLFLREQLAHLSEQRDLAPIYLLENSIRSALLGATEERRMIVDAARMLQNTYSQMHKELARLTRLAPIELKEVPQVIREGDPLVQAELNVLKGDFHKLSAEYNRLKTSYANAVAAKELLAKQFAETLGYPPDF